MTSFLLWYLTEATFPPSPEWKRTEESKQLILFLETDVMVELFRRLLGCVCFLVQEKRRLSAEGEGTVEGGKEV